MCNPTATTCAPTKSMKEEKEEEEHRGARKGGAGNGVRRDDARVTTVDRDVACGVATELADASDEEQSRDDE